MSYTSNGACHLQLQDECCPCFPNKCPSAFSREHHLVTALAAQSVLHPHAFLPPCPPSTMRSPDQLPHLTSTRQGNGGSKGRSSRYQRRRSKQNLAKRATFEGVVNRREDRRPKFSRCCGFEQIDRNISNTFTELGATTRHP